MALQVHSFFYCFFVAITVVVVFFAAPSASQPQAAGSCDGIFLSYVYTGGSRLPPNVSDPAGQPYRFESTLTVLNNGLEELKSWRVFVGFKHREWLVSVSNAVLADGTSLPGSVENGTILSGATVRDLKTAVATAGDLNEMEVRVKMVGTLFGVTPPSVPMPSSLTLANDGYVCGQPSGQGSNESDVCCTSDPNFKTNITTQEEEFLPRRKGDLSITYDIIRTYDSDYWAEVTITNHNPLGRLDNWRLSWDWNNNEFIHTMKGAYPLNVDSSDCVFGPQGTFYKDLDFANVINCERRPTIVDLPPTMFNNTDFGKIPFCCRNGTILPPTMDPSMSSSRFQLQVFKMPPNLNRSNLSPPHNWEIKGTLNPDYVCGNPIRVSPSESPDQTHPASNKSAIASWQVVCNITNTKREARKCCVSFSAYYNESVIPCNTCACGCNNNPERTCSATSQAMLLPSEALLVPFENRTKKTLLWADINHLNVPNPMPCGDNCGVSINWHVATDHRDGWSARITLFNWGETSFADWFTAVEMDKAAKGFEEVYSFNGSVLEGVDGTIFMQGKKGLNFLVAETNGSNPQRDPRVPGKQQSVISFKKKNTPGIDVAGGNGFPSKVFFNGEECSLPSVIPTSDARMEVSLATIMVFLILFLFHFLLF